MPAKLSLGRKPVCIATAAMLLLAFRGVPMEAQATQRLSTIPSPTQSPTQSQVPLPHLYWHLLFYKNYLDRKADALEQQGQVKQARLLRNHLQKELHFTDAQFAIVRETGMELERSYNDITAKMRPIMAQDRQWIRLHGRASGPPPGHAEVHELGQEREIVITQGVESLNQRLGSTEAAKLQTYVEKSWSSHVTLRQVQGPAHRAHSLPPAPHRLQSRQEQHLGVQP